MEMAEIFKSFCYVEQIIKIPKGYKNILEFQDFEDFFGRCYIAQKLRRCSAQRDRKTILSGWIWQMQKKSSSSFFSALHNNED